MFITRVKLCMSWALFLLRSTPRPCRNHAMKLLVNKRKFLDQYASGAVAMIQVSAALGDLLSVKHLRTEDIVILILYCVYHTTEFLEQDHTQAECGYCGR